jgi:hypothetical protein
MKKYYLILAAMSALVLAACQREIAPQKGLVFTATTESSVTKTALSENGGNYDVVWRAGDRITIVDAASNVGIYETESTTTHADFSLYGGSTPVTTPTYKAWYPANLYNGGTPTLPATQSYVDGNIGGSPMYAESGTNSLAFKNICGIIRLNVSTTLVGKTVASIVLNANEGMSGVISNAATLADDSYVAAVTGTAGVTLNCGAGIDISTTPTAFHFAVPEGTYTGFTITVTTTDGLTQTRTANKGITVGRRQITDIGLAFNNLSMAINLAETTGTVDIPSGVNARLYGSKTDRTVNVAGGGSVVTLENASMYKLNLNGDAIIVSSGTNTIDTSHDNPVFIKEGSTATFRGTGTLNVNAYYCTGPIICENYNADIVIESGTYNLNAGAGATRCIGAGNLSITGGTVNADTEAYVSLYAEKTLSISGGEVLARGDAQGIYANGGDVVISGGTVTAEQRRNSTFWGGPEANVAGIVVHSKDGTTGGTLTISGGTVNAIGHIGPGIGATWHRSGWSYAVHTRSILISGGTVTSSSDVEGQAAIGFSGFGNPTVCEKITISPGITSLTLIQGPTATRMITYGDSPAAFTVDGLDMSGYFSDPASVDWSTLPNLLRTVTTTTAADDTWVFTPKP